MYKSHDVNNPDYDTVKVTGVCVCVCVCARARGRECVYLGGMCVCVSVLSVASVCVRVYDVRLRACV
jgi:hypothetical protein